MNFRPLICLSLVLGFAPSLCSATDISLFALFQDKAILKIDGARRVLAAGQVSPEGVKLISADPQSEEAVVEIAGKQQTLRLGVVISAFKSAARESVTLYAGTGGHFFADGAINGQPVHFLVDTGATTVALSSSDARRLGIDYKRFGERGLSQTASGIAKMYSLRLKSVSVGNVTLYDVEAGVIEGNFPTEPLLGMTFLSAFEMKREGDRLELTRRY
jgi:aspartyl protease family protein